MKKKNRNKRIVGIVLSAITILIIGLCIHGGGQQIVPNGDIVNGIYNPDTGDCEPDPDNIATMATCCYNELGKQVDCNNPDVVIGEGNGQALAIYQGNSGIMSIQHTFTVTNTGNIDITNAWIDSAVWSPSHSTLTSAYAGILGSANGKPILSTEPDSYVSWSTANIDLQSIGGTGSPTTYDLTLTVKADAPNLETASSTKQASMTVEKETIGFDVDINFGF